MSKKKKSQTQERQERLLRLFDGDGYEEFHTPKFIFVKQWNGNTDHWQVAIYPIDSWQRMQAGSESYRQQQHLRSILQE